MKYIFCFLTALSSWSTCFADHPDHIGDIAYFTDPDESPKTVWSVELTGIDSVKNVLKIKSGNEETWNTSLTEAIPHSIAQDIFANCGSKYSGIIETVTVGAGTFSVCSYQLASYPRLTLSVSPEVPMGIVKSVTIIRWPDSVTFELEKYMYSTQ